MVYMLCLSKQYVPPSRTLRFASVLTHLDNKRVSGSGLWSLRPNLLRFAPQTSHIPKRYMKSHGGEKNDRKSQENV